MSPDNHAEELAMKRKLTYDVNQPIDPRKVVAKGLGLKEACPSKEAVFTIYQRGPSGEPVPGVRQEDLRVVIRGGPTNVQGPNMVDHGDGRISVSYTPTVSGKYTIVVRVFLPLSHSTLASSCFTTDYFQG